jgi:hypothetical protein
MQLQVDGTLLTDFHWTISERISQQDAQLSELANQVRFTGFAFSPCEVFSFVSWNRSRT